MTVSVEHFTDPNCPVAFSAEAQRRRVDWLYGDGLDWHHRMVVIRENAEELDKLGITPEKLAGWFEVPQRRWGMPLSLKAKSRVAVSMPACHFYLGVARHADASVADRVLRQLRVWGVGGDRLIDEEPFHREIALEVGLDPDEAIEWATEPETEERLAADMAAARQPKPAARALGHRLGGGKKRYGTPSYELSANSETIVMPGYQPAATLEIAIANLEPGLARRADPEGAEEVLEWAGEPLATAEVAAVLDVEIDEARSKLEQSPARFQPGGEDGYWVL
jgi:hypothetical protein